MLDFIDKRSEYARFIGLDERNKCQLGSTSRGVEQANLSVAVRQVAIGIVAVINDADDGSVGVAVFTFNSPVEPVPGLFDILLEVTLPRVVVFSEMKGGLPMAQLIGFLQILFDLFWGDVGRFIIFFGIMISSFQASLEETVWVVLITSKIKQHGEVDTVKILVGALDVV